MSSDRDDPRGKIHKAGQTFVFDFSKDVAEQKSPGSDPAETFTIPSFLRTGPSGGRSAAPAPAPGNATWLEEDFARIAQTAKRQPRDPAPEPTEQRVAEESLARDASAAPEQMSKEEEAAPVTVAETDMDDIGEAPVPDSKREWEAEEKQEPRWSVPRDMDERRNVPEARSVFVRPDASDAPFRAAKPAWRDEERREPLWSHARKPQAPEHPAEAPSGYIRPEADETIFRPSMSSWSGEERRQPLWNGPRNPDRQWEEDWRRLDIPSIDDDGEEIFVPPVPMSRRRPVSSVTWLLLFAAVAAGGYGFMRSWREAAPANTNQLAMLTPNESVPTVLPSQPAQAVPPVDLRATVPDRNSASSAIVPAPTAPKASPRKNADETFGPRTWTEPPRYVEKRSVMSEPRSKPEESTPSHVVLAPGPHPLTAPSSYEAARGGAVLASFASDIQARLILLGYSVPRSGALDAETRQAIRLFQTNSGLPPTGEVDSQTLDRLNSIPEAQMQLVKEPDSITPP